MKITDDFIPPNCITMADFIIDESRLAASSSNNNLTSKNTNSSSGNNKLTSKNNNLSSKNTNLSSSNNNLSSDEENLESLREHYDPNHPDSWLDEILESCREYYAFHSQFKQIPNLFNTMQRCKSDLKFIPFFASLAFCPQMLKIYIKLELNSWTAKTFDVEDGNLRDFVISCITEDLQEPWDLFYEAWKTKGKVTNYLTEISIPFVGSTTILVQAFELGWIDKRLNFGVRRIQKLWRIHNSKLYDKENIFRVLNEELPITNEMRSLGYRAKHWRDIKLTYEELFPELIKWSPDIVPPIVAEYSRYIHPKIIPYRMIHDIISMIPHISKRIDIRNQKIKECVVEIVKDHDLRAKMLNLISYVNVLENGIYWNCPTLWMIRFSRWSYSNYNPSPVGIWNELTHLTFRQAVALLTHLPFFSAEWTSKLVDLFKITDLNAISYKELTFWFKYMVAFDYSKDVTNSELLTINELITKNNIWPKDLPLPECLSSLLKITRTHSNSEPVIKFCWSDSKNNGKNNNSSNNSNSSGNNSSSNSNSGNSGNTGNQETNTPVNSSRRSRLTSVKNIQPQIRAITTVITKTEILPEIIPWMNRSLYDPPVIRSMKDILSGLQDTIRQDIIPNGYKLTLISPTVTSIFDK